MNKYDVIVVGGGPSGLLAAGHAAELGAKVLLLEKMRRPGVKLLITGKGRCNITNTDEIEDFIKHVHPEGRFLRNAFYNFFSDDIVSLLNKRDVETVIERGGRIFPVSNKSVDVVNAFVSFAQENGVDIKCNCVVKDLMIENGKLIGLEFYQNDKIEKAKTKSVIICTGGKSYPATGSTGDGYKIANKVGHNIETPYQSLVPIETHGSIAKRLQGLSLKNVTASVYSNDVKIIEYFGEMLFTHFGLSGPIILTLSRFIVSELLKKKSITISIDLKPALDHKRLDARLLRDLDTNGKKQLENIFRLWVPLKLIPVLIEKCKLDPRKKGHQISGQDRKDIISIMKDFRFEVSQPRPFKEAIITAGGVSTKEINPKTMESKIIENLYFAGELVDVDADTGGYNLQIAYSTGWLAADACVNNLN